METTAYLLEAFRTEDFSHLFLVPGGLIAPSLPAFSATDGITPIVAAHEGGAAYVEAMGRCSQYSQSYSHQPPDHVYTSAWFTIFEFDLTKERHLTYDSKQNTR